MIDAPVRELSITATPEITSEERTWAAIAHLSSVLTLSVSFFTAGIGAIPLVFIPLVIYISFRDKSRFVAYHAAQAVALQTVGTVGYLAGLIVGTVVLALVATVVTAIGAILTIILIGLVVLAVAAVLWVIVGLFPVIWYALVPLGLGVLSMIAGVETLNGRNYQYPYLGSWVADWLARYEPSSSAPPAV